MPYEMHSKDTMNQKNVVTVTQLNRQVRSWLEHELGEVSVTGELSNTSRPASGHLYFTLKDESAQLRCVFFRSNHNRDSKNLVDGQQVIASGRLSLYEARGDYQLIVSTLVQAGAGALYLQFERLKAKLQQQGLFAPERKKQLPRYPAVIAVITSGSGAALQDILNTLKRRFPIADVHIYPCEVQGKTAAGQLVKAIIKANLASKANVILLARGGGSIEDLWPFNEEELALAISQSHIPIISGVGHETDFTIADFVADKRAATPTAAAVAATPDALELLGCIESFTRRMSVALSQRMRHQQLVLSHLVATISSPEQIISRHWQTLDYREQQLHQLMGHCVRHQHHRLQMALSLLQAKSPTLLLQQSRSRLKQAKLRLQQVTDNRIKQLKQEFTRQIATLQAVSPLATLERGYAIATSQNRIIVSSKQVCLGDTINLRLAKGYLICEVMKTGTGDYSQ